jgi:hypothetical protein
LVDVSDATSAVTNSMPGTDLPANQPPAKDDFDPGSTALARNSAICALILFGEGGVALFPAISRCLSTGPSRIDLR